MSDTPKLTERITVDVALDVDPKRLHPAERKAIASDIDAVKSYLELMVSDWLKGTWPFFNPTVEVAVGYEDDEVVFTPDVDLFDDDTGGGVTYTIDTSGIVWEDDGSVN